MRIAKLIPSFIVASSFAVSAGAVPLSYGNWDTRSAGSYSASSFSNDGDGSLLLQTFDNTSQGKVAVIFGTGSSMGKLSDLNDVSLTYYKSSDPVTPAANQFAYRLQLSDGTSNNISLVWENNYNGSAAVPTDSWQSLDLTNGNFWLYDGVTNHNGGSDAHPLSYYTQYANADVLGLQVAYGSGVGAFTGYVDNVDLSFNNATSGPMTYTGNVVAPEPASVGLLGMGMLGLVRRKRKQASK